MPWSEVQDDAMAVNTRRAYAGQWDGRRLPVGGIGLLKKRLSTTSIKERCR